MLIAPKEKKTGLKASNISEPHEIILREAGFEGSEEIGIVPMPKAKGKELSFGSIYFYKKDVPKLIKKLREVLLNV
jgi:hypothetical protein